MIHAFFLAFLQFLAPATGQPSGQPASQTAFSLRVEQKKKNVQIVEHEVRLKKKFFDLVFEFNQPGGVAVVASLDSAIFKLAAAGVPAKQIPGFAEFDGGACFAEELRNPSQDIWIMKDSYHYWYYDNRQTNRFNRTSRSGNTITCYRSVGKIQLLDTNESFDIGDALVPLYLVFAQLDGSQMDYLKINWK